MALQSRGGGGLRGIVSILAPYMQQKQVQQGDLQTQLLMAAIKQKMTQVQGQQGLTDLDAAIAKLKDVPDGYEGSVTHKMGGTTFSVKKKDIDPTKQALEESLLGQRQAQTQKIQDALAHPGIGRLFQNLMGRVASPFQQITVGQPELAGNQTKKKTTSGMGYSIE